MFDAITLVGSPGVWVVTALFALWLLRRRERFLFLAWIASNVGGGLLQLVLKATVHHTRPQYAARFCTGSRTAFRAATR